MNIYSRQENLYEVKKNGNSYFQTMPQSATVIGLGGIGAWVALDLALLGVNELTLIDPDTIEDHNLNRTPFKLTQIGLYKTEAVKYLIAERRNTNVITYEKKFEFLPKAERNRILKNLIIDCRDNLETIYNAEKVIYLRYDGISMTIMPSLPDPAFISHTAGYTTTPSIVMPPQLLASLVSFIVLYSLKVDTQTFDMFDILINLGVWNGERFFYDE